MPRVKACNEDVRKYIKHPSRGIGFGADINTAVEWPDDTFTRRRIRDGDVEVVDKDKEKSAAASPGSPANATHRKHREPAG